MAQPYQLESRRLSAKWTRGFAAHLSLLVFVAVFGIGVAQAEFDDEKGDDDVGRVVVGSGRVGIPQSAGSKSETRQKVTIEPPERDANACRSDPTWGPEIVDIEGGHFWRGSLYGDSDEKPVHKVAVQPLSLIHISEPTRPY